MPDRFAVINRSATCDVDHISATGDIRKDIASASLLLT